ncbi:MAG: DUF481 domain-containing protein [Bdellovibrionaceae bacterium]|nr:DUF481 domain-containing protein [Pseudobdellovibrionaceae bacterium]
MRNYILALTVTVTVLASPAWAFINIESVRMGTKDPFVGKAQLLLSGNGGNTNKSTAAFSSVNIRRWSNSEFLALIDYNYETTNSARNVNNGRLHLRQTFASREVLAYEFFVQNEFDEFQNLNARRLAGANLRHEIFRDETNAFFLGTGLFYEDEDYKLVEDRYGTRGNLYLSYTEKITEALQGSATIYYQPSLSRANDYRIRLQSGLHVRMTERFAVNLEFELKHESNLPDPRLQSTDTRYLAGFSVTY